jgi:hypothetical protein
MFAAKYWNNICKPSSTFSSVNSQPLSVILIATGYYIVMLVKMIQPEPITFGCWYIFYPE